VSVPGVAASGIDHQGIESDANGRIHGQSPVNCRHGRGYRQRPAQVPGRLSAQSAATDADAINKDGRSSSASADLPLPVGNRQSCFGPPAPDFRHHFSDLKRRK